MKRIPPAAALVLRHRLLPALRRRRRPGHAAPARAERPGRPAGHHRRGLRRAGPAERDPSHRGQQEPQARGVPDRLLRVRVHPREAPRIRHRRGRHDRPARARTGRPGTPSRPSSGSVEPELRKIADLDDVPASLCSGSESTDTTAELVYVGPGNREEFYKDKDVEGKILLVNGPPEMAPADRRPEIRRRGARRLVVEPSRVRPGRGRLERPAAGREGPGDVRLHGLRAAGPGAPGRPGARPQDRRPGRRQDPGRQGRQGPADRRPDQGDRPRRRGARLHRPPLRGLGQAGRQRQRLRLHGHPGDGPGAEEARRPRARSRRSGGPCASCSCPRSPGPRPTSG